MSMAQQELDYTTLKWVKEEIQESLNQTRQALESFVENPQDSTQIRFCTTYLHQIYGTLQMVEIYGGALLAEEMELLANAILQEKVARKDDAYDVLMRAILQLPAYLEQLENGQQDLPVILLPLLNDLRTARGEHLLSENAFFSPDLAVKPPDEPAKTNKQPIDSQKYARKLRPVYQASLVGLYRNKNAHESIRKLGLVIRELLYNSQNENAARLWWVTSGVIEALLEGGIEASNSVKQLLGHVDRQIKRLIDNNEDTFAASPPVELLKNLLYYIATSKSQGRRVGQIKMAFKLDQLLPGGGDIAEAFEKLRGSNAELMHSVSAVIKEDLLSVKDQLDIFVRNKDRNPQQLNPLTENLARISDTLAMLGLGDLHKIIQDQLKNINEISVGGAPPSEMALMEIASALLYVESSLEGVQSAQYSRALKTQAAETESLLPASEQKQLTNFVIGEAALVITQVKEAFNQFASDVSNHEVIKDAPELLEQVKGVLAILSYNHAAALMNAAIAYIKVELLDKRLQPNRTALDLLADVITSVEYFLEAIVDSRTHPNSILGVAEESINKLGYPIERLGEASIAAKAGAEKPKPISMQAVEAAAHAAQEEVGPRVEERPAPAVVPTQPVQKPAPAASSTFQLPEDDIDEEILEIFVEEADEVVGAMKENLAAWKKNNNNNDALMVLRRSYHTIKGSGRLAGAKVVGEFAWAIENMLNRVIDGKTELHPAMFELLQHAESTLELCIEHLKGDRETQPNVQTLVELADALANGSYHEGMQMPGADAPDAAAQSTAELPQPTQDNVLADIFRKETTSHINAIHAYLEAYSDEQNNYVDELLMRALHTLHGSANMAGVTPIAEMSEHLDRFFRTLHDTKQPVTSDAYDVLTQGADIIEKLVVAFSTDTNMQLEDHTDLVRRIKELHDEAKLVKVPEEDVYAIVPKSEPSKQTPKSGFEFKSLDEGVLKQLTDSEEVELEDQDEELVSIFLEEADEILHNTEALIQGWSSTPNDQSIMEELQRALHTLKGGARMASIKPVADLSHRIESLVESIVEGQIQPNPEIPKLVHRCQDWLVNTMDSIRDRGMVGEAKDLSDELQTFIDGTASVADETITLQESESPEQSADTELLMLDDTPNTDGIESITLEDSNIDLENDAPLELADTDQTDSDYEDDDLLNIFLDEATDIQRENEAPLKACAANINDVENLAALQRSLHTIKGGARMAKINSIANLSNALESLLEKIVDHSFPINKSLIPILQDSHQWIKQALDSVRQRKSLEEASALLHAIENYQAHAHDADEDDSSNIVDAPTIEFNFKIPDAAESQDEISAIDSIDAPVDEPTEQLTAPASFEIEDKMSEQAQQTSSADIEADFDEDLVSIFLEEAEEIQENNDRILNKWVKDVSNHELISELQRALHTLKGGARMANIAPIGDLSHAIESLLESVTEGQLSPTPEYPKVVHACHDWLSTAIDNVKRRQPISRASSLLKQLENLLAGKTAMDGVDIDEQTPSKITHAPGKAAEAKQAGDEKPKAEIKPEDLIELPSFDNADTEAALYFARDEHASKQANRAIEEQIRVKADMVDNLVNYAGEANIYNARISQQLNQWHFNLTELDQTVLRLYEQLRKFEIEAEAQIMYRHGSNVIAGDHAEDFDPLELDRFSHMQQLSRSMAESLNDLSNIQQTLTGISGEADVLLLQQSRINNDIQENLMRTRMTPFSSVIARLRRVVRQTCQETEKEAELQVQGAEGEMDRTQLNRIVPALEHILRNAVDHGIEKPAARKKDGKPEAGAISIDFTREGSEILLTITDDGAGINIKALRDKAIERGLIKENSKITDDEVIDFILQSGFSTAKQVTQISGRGVGMDVVNTEIKQLNGSLHIATHEGKGSKFTIRLPLTVLVNQALMIQVDEAIYALQLSNIEHVVRVSGDELGKMISGETKHFEYAGYQYQHLNIGYILHGSPITPTSGKTRQPLLLARSGEQRVALHIDQMLGRQEIVIKSVGPQLSSVNSISGATILPDGEVALILDLATLIRTAHALEKVDEAADGEIKKPKKVKPPVSKQAVAKAPTVLIVDDSITVRKVTQRLLKRHNFETLTAKDGVDALTVMLEVVPDIMLLDIEMPRMDGYELAKAMRNDQRLKNIPIIMITSRTGDKHRDRALEIGVNQYMGKPFQEQELLENIQSLLQDQ